MVATGDRKKWRRRIRVADPSPGGINSSLKEIYNNGGLYLQDRAWYSDLGIKF